MGLILRSQYCRGKGENIRAPDMTPYFLDSRGFCGRITACFYHKNVFAVNSLLQELTAVLYYIRQNCLFLCTLRTLINPCFKPFYRPTKLLPLAHCQCFQQGVALTNPHGSANLLWNNDPAQVVSTCQERSKKFFIRSKP